MDAEVHIYTAKALGRGRVARPKLSRLYLQERTQYSFYMRLNGLQDQFGHEEVKESLHPSTPGIEPGSSRL